VAAFEAHVGCGGVRSAQVAPLAHFVGCPDKAGGFKALGWWDYRSEEINAIVHGKPPPPSLPQRRYLTVKGPSFEYKDLKKFHEKYFTAVGRLLVLAILSDRRAVAPPIPCSSGWITSRVPESWHGIDQVRWMARLRSGQPAGITSEDRHMLQGATLPARVSPWPSALA
jgi:hypothetical protein